MIRKYQQLPYELRTIIDDDLDDYVYNQLVKPTQNCLITELKYFFEPKCEACFMPLLYIDYTGEFVYYIRTHGLCVKCMNEFTESDDDSVELNDWFEEGSTTSDISSNTI